VLEITKRIGEKEESGRKKETDGFFSQICTLYFDGSKSQEGLEVGASSLIQKVNKIYFPLD
jgi:hypothetical protein